MKSYLASAALGTGAVRKVAVGPPDNAASARVAVPATVVAVATTRVQAIPASAAAISNCAVLNAAIRAIDAAKPAACAVWPTSE